MGFLLFITLAASSAVVLVSGYVAFFAFRPPSNRPSKYVKNPQDDRILLACLGDSITHGSISQNYIDNIIRHFADNQIAVVNAGINGDLAYNLLLRVDEVSQCDPQIITILIGTNDVNATLSDINLDYYMQKKKLPQKPDINWYEENLTKIVRKLKQNTQADIAVFTLPVLGEQLDHVANQKAKQYSEIIKKVATQERLVYLPLNERQRRYLEQYGKNTPSPLGEKRNGTVKAIFHHYLLGKSYDAISRQNGLVLTSEGLHMNSKGAKMISDLAIEFIGTSVNSLSVEKKAKVQKG